MGTGQQALPSPHCIGHCVRGDAVLLGLKYTRNGTLEYAVCNGKGCEDINVLGGARLLQRSLLGADRRIAWRTPYTGKSKWDYIALNVMQCKQHGLAESPAFQLLPALQQQQQQQQQ
jgi:hypothetical protein